MTDNLISINDYTVLRRDRDYPLHTGLDLYVHKSVENRVRRRIDLENRSNRMHLDRIPDSKLWSDDFVNMMDKVTESNANILLLSDFNIDLFKQPPAWNSISFLFEREQLVEEATRVTKSSATLVAHIYTNNKPHVSKVKVVESGISDHDAVFCNWSLKLSKKKKKKKKSKGADSHHF